MKDKDKKPTQREHADFQNEYRRSSNFPSLKEDETDELAIKGDGELKVKKEGEPNEESDKKKIKDTLDALKEEEE